MKTIIAFVQPFMAEKVVQALHGVEGLSGATCTRVYGFGRGRGSSAERRHEEVFGTTAKVRIEAMIPDRLERSVVEVICRAAHTGRKGDGKIYVMPLEGAIRIQTGEQGEAAV